MTGFKPPNAKQIEMIDTVVCIISGWRATNDISSPTHSSDILEELKKLDLSGEQMETLYRHVLDIWFDVLVND